MDDKQARKWNSLEKNHSFCPNGKYRVVYKVLNNQKTFVMKEFALIFHVSGQLGADASPAEMQQRMTTWMNWMGGIAAKDRLVSNGNRLGIKGSKWVGPDKVVSDGPYTEVKEFINGYVIVRAETPEEAAEFAKECPIVVGEIGKVEVRPLVAPDNNH
jgi:hypothetical protein